MWNLKPDNLHVLSSKVKRGESQHTGIAQFIALVYVKGLIPGVERGEGCPISTLDQALYQWDSRTLACVSVPTPTLLSGHKVNILLTIRHHKRPESKSI